MTGHLKGNKNSNGVNNAANYKTLNSKTVVWMIN